MVYKLISTILLPFFFNRMIRVVSGMDLKAIETYLSQNGGRNSDFYNFRMEETAAFCNEFTHKSFVENVNTDTIVFNTQVGKVFPGDLLVWNNEIFETNSTTNGVEGSTIQGTCTFLPSLIYQCLVTIDIPTQGRIQFQGSFKESPDRLAVVGGTDCYQVINGGELLITPEGSAEDKKTHYDVTLHWY